MSSKTLKWGMVFLSSSAPIPIASAYILQKDWPEKHLFFGNLSFNPWLEVFSSIKWIPIISGILVYVALLTFQRICCIGKPVANFRNLPQITLVLLQVILWVSIVSTLLASVSVYINTKTSPFLGPPIDWPSVYFVPFLISIIYSVTLTFLFRRFERDQNLEVTST